jgi:hypothetical protein
MISDETIARIAKLLETPLSERRIAAIAGVSRGTVKAVSLGRLIVGRRTCKRNPNAPTPPAYHHGESSLDRFERCEGCGGMVVKPCYLCAIRAVKRALAEVV